MRDVKPFFANVIFLEIHLKLMGNFAKAKTAELDLKSLQRTSMNLSVDLLFSQYPRKQFVWIKGLEELFSYDLVMQI